MERTWDIGDGRQRWVRGVSQPKFLVTLISKDVIVYVSGAHLKFARLANPFTEVIRVCHPDCAGINLLEGNPVIGAFAVAEICIKPRVLIYKYEKGAESLIAQLRGSAETEIRAVRFAKKDLFLILSGAPEFSINVWKWASEQEIVKVSTYQESLFSDLQISKSNQYYWVEWGTNHMNFWELQSFTECDVTRSEITLPENESKDFVPDHRLGSKFSFDIISAVWDYLGVFYVLDEYRTLHKLHILEKCLSRVGEIPYDSRVFIYRIVPYGDFLGALVDDGTFLILTKLDGDILVKSKLKFTSALTHLIPNVTAPHPSTSFYGITDVDKKVECVMNGKFRTGHNLVDFQFSELRTACFIEPDSEYLAVLTDKGQIHLLDTKNGNVFCRWKLDFFVCSIASHPVFHQVVVGSMDGCAYFLDISENVKVPRLLSRSYFHAEAVIDTLAFMSRGRLLIAADSSCGLLFLQFAIPTMDYEFLDQANLEGTIRAINTPLPYKDKRFQVLVQRDRSEELAIVVNNYRVDGDCFEIVASQFLDCSVTTMCFSNFKKLMYGFSAENGMSMLQFAEDMNAGSLKEPDTTFQCDHLTLDVNMIRLIGSTLYSFGQDGWALAHDAPPPKAKVLDTKIAIRTHFAAYGGIRDGLISMNGCHLVTFGTDNTIVHVTLKSKENAAIDWNGLQFGTESNIKRMIREQTHHAAVAGIHIIKPLGDFDKSLSVLLMEEVEMYEVRSTEEEVRYILDGLAEIREEVTLLMDLNDSYEEFEKVPLEEFELDEEEEEEAELEFEQNRKMTEALVVASVEEREQWADEMKDFLYNRFEVKSCTLKGFHFDKEVSNYPLAPMTKELDDVSEDVREERRLEKKLFRARREILKLQAAHNADIKRIRKASRKKRPKKKIDFSRFPPHMREEMRALFEEMATPESASSSSTDQAEEAEIQDEMGYFERMLKRQSAQAEREDDDVAAASKKKLDDLRELQKLDINMDDPDAMADEDEEDEDEDEDEDEEDEEDDVPDKIDDEEEESSESSGELDYRSSSSESDNTRSKRKAKNRIFFGRPSKQALEAQGISAKDADIITARAEKAAEAEEKMLAQKQEAAKLAKEREIAEMEKTRQAAFMTRHNIETSDKGVKHSPSEVVTLVPPRSPRPTDSEDEDEDEEVIGEPYIKGKRKHIKVKKTVVVNDVEVEEWVSESDSSEDSEEEVNKEKSLEKAKEEYKLKFMSNTQISRNAFIKSLESGGRTREFFEPCFGFYPQMETYSLHQHIAQMELVKYDLRKLQSLFNTEFETVRRLKDTTAKGIVQRNDRIREIADYLNIELDIKDPEYNIWEHPDNIFVVTNEEVPLEPYLTAAEREELERLRLEEEARRLAKAENFREKALIVMMDGVLESRREDVLRKDVPKPRFMLQKEQWEWNFEDYRRADDYYELVEQLEVLREEFRKELEIELRQLIKLNLDARSIFDKRLAQLFTYKLSVEHAVRLEEMKILRLTRQLTRRDIYQRREDAQSQALRRLQERMKEAKNLGSEIAARVVVASQLYEEILEREKTMIAEFRGSILEAGPYMETFLRLYRKTPKLLVKQDQMQELLGLMIKGLDSPNLRMFANEHGELGHLAADAIFELDEPIQIPVGCPRSTWDKFCRLRRNRIIAEFEARVTGTELVQLRAVIAECKKREDEIANEMAQVLAKMSEQKNLKIFHIQNGEMQMVVPQGRIESLITRARDFNDITICNTGVILKLNDFIKSYTATLVTQLAKSKIQHRQILQIDWKFRKINLREKHLLAKKKDIASLRVTKEVLEFLRLHHDFRSMQDQRLIRIRKLQEMAELFHQRYMDGMDKLNKIIQSGVNKFEKDSNRKHTKLDKRNIRYNTLKVKCNVEHPELEEAKRVERLQMIMRISHMARIYSQFEETIVALETELERLYDRTYPYL